jgi:plasmid stabilization system protein ParE
MANILWTPYAVAELEEILLYIAIEDGRPATAAKINDEIEERLKLFALSPEIGQRLEGLPDDWRFLRHKRWVIFYRPHTTGIEVLRVIDGSRDFRLLFGGEISP